MFPDSFKKVDKVFIGNDGVEIKYSFKGIHRDGWRLLREDIKMHYRK